MCQSGAADSHQQHLTLQLIESEESLTYTPAAITPVVVGASELSPEQLAIVNHPITGHARVLAGPGTGKSFTATQLLGKLHGSGPAEIRSKMLTFTRAATAEFAAKMEKNGLGGLSENPSTVHSHALSILLKTPSRQLPLPESCRVSWRLNPLRGLLHVKNTPLLGGVT